VTLAGCAAEHETKVPVATASLAPPKVSHLRRARTPIALPDKALLEPQPDPDCQFQGAATDERQKLDYQQQCYRQAEMIVRDRLRQLQKSAGKSIRDKALLEPQPNPDCQFKGAAADERQKLDYQQQCYRKAETVAHDRLRELQKSVGKIEAVKHTRRAKRASSEN
jgi:hypothetical protein